MARPVKQFEQEGAEIRVPYPKGKQILGFVELRLGYGKSRVRCTDGKTRVCRVPGARRRDLWIRPDDIVLVEPWEIQGDEYGDIVYKYYPIQAKVLRDKGFLKNLTEAEEF